MKKMTGEQVINTFLDYFKEHGHSVIESAPLIPKDDPSVLWINAGVTPLKKYFDGSIVPENRRMVGVQKCIRTGDIESVGKTARHHTFFQMLGNFSVGDYFKDEAIEMAYDLLINEKYFGLEKDKLYFTVYSTDDVAYNKWLSLGVDKSHIIRLENNFWEIGEGPSGPDSEVFFDRGEKYDKDKQGIRLLEQEIENDRYIEIWNNVFSQYNAEIGLKRSEYKELPSKNIDTGMGVERMACILQEVETNYETDLFVPIIKKIEEISTILYKGQMEFKVIADHIRTIVFALSDGATFSNYGRGYVLRRLLRRSVRMGRKLGINRSFLSDLVDTVVSIYVTTYRNLSNDIKEIKEDITKEEELFQRTLISGEKKLEEMLLSSDKKISGLDAYRLYDTYGFPLELTIEIALEKGFTVDSDEFNKYMNDGRILARNSRKEENSMHLQNELLLNYKEETEFVGYECLECASKVIDIIKDNQFVDNISDEGYVVLDKTPFYATSGGQIADTGKISGRNVLLEVKDVIKAPNKQHLMYVKVKRGVLQKGDIVTSSVDKSRRFNIMKNHSSVHLLQKTLQDLLSSKVHQAGSSVLEESFRFDFTYQGKLSDVMILDIEKKVNEKIAEGVNSKIEFLSLEDAIKKNAMALFEDKYGNVVRVVTLGDSIELCAGTHVKNTKDINKFAILSLENKGSNVYRITGATDKFISKMLSLEIKPYRDEITKLLEKAKKIVLSAKELSIDLDFDFSVDFDELDSYKDVIDIKNNLNVLKEKVKELEKKYKDKKVTASIRDLSAFTNNKIMINDVNTIVAITDNYENSVLKQIIDELSNKYKLYFILLANTNNDNVNFVCKSNYDKINVGDVIKELSQKCRGNGGGNKNFAQGGGTDIKNLGAYLQDIKEYLRNVC